MRFKRGLGILTIAAITTAPVAAVISCGAEAAPLSMEGAQFADKTEVNPFQLNCLPFPDGKSLFTPNQLKTFQGNLLKDLYYGPEAWDLKSITLDPGHITSGSQLGVYYPASKQIFINIGDLEGSFPGKYSIDKVYKVIEKVIAHEYGHHYFATYANGYTRNDPAVKNSDGYVYDTEGNQRYISAWNEKYFDEFTNHYNMLDDKATLATSTSYQPDNIDKVFTLKNLFDNANKKGGSLNWNGHSKVSFASSAPVNVSGTPASYLVSVDKDNEGNLRYIYSMDEQVTRKMQMMFYPSPIDGGRYSFDSSLLKISAGKSSFFDPYAVDWMRTADLYRTNSGKIEKQSIYKDDIFVNGKVGEAYGDLLDLMGYGDEISHMFSDNSAKVSGPSSVVGLTSANNNHVRITGYLKNASAYDRIVDNAGHKIMFDQDDKTKFNFKHKKTWNASVANVGPLENYETYITESFDISKLNGQQLYFQNGENGVKVAIKKINQDTDGNTNVNSYDSQRPDGTYYKLSFENGKTTVGRYI